MATLLSASKQEQADIERSIILNCLGIFVYQVLQTKSNSLGERLFEIINIFISETRVKKKPNLNQSFLLNFFVLCFR